jgi:hypothetical protein
MLLKEDGVEKLEVLQKKYEEMIIKRTKEQKNILK